MKRGTHRTPNPLPFAQIRRKEDAPKIRRLLCRSYDECLDQADVFGWSGFTCTACLAYERRSAEELLYDVDRLLACAAKLGGVGERYFDDEFWAQLGDEARDVVEALAKRAVVRRRHAKKAA
jgi:hypothetical protein